MSLQAKLDAFKAEFEAGKPPYSVPRSVIDAMHQATDELIASGAASARNFVADLNSHRRVIILQRLDVRIDGDEIDVAQTHRNHVVDRIAAASTSADNLDSRARVGITHQLNHHRTSCTTYRQILLLV